MRKFGSTADGAVLKSPMAPKIAQPMKLPHEVEPLEGVPTHKPPPELDVTRARRETPGCQHVAHFNNAGAALMPEPAVEAVVSHLRLESEIGGYEAATRAEAAVGGVYAAAARLLNVDTSEIAIVDNATRAWGGFFIRCHWRRATVFSPARRSTCRTIWRFCS